MSKFSLELRRADQILDGLIETLAQSPQPSLAVTQDHLTRAFAAILQVEESLREGMHWTENPSLQLEIREYRDRLARVRSLMPSLHVRLLTERARLEAERSHLEAAGAWADASKATV